MRFPVSILRPSQAELIAMRVAYTALAADVPDLAAFVAGKSKEMYFPKNSTPEYVRASTQAAYRLIDLRNAHPDAFTYVVAPP